MYVTKYTEYEKNVSLNFKPSAIAWNGNKTNTYIVGIVLNVVDAREVFVGVFPFFKRIVRIYAIAFIIILEPKKQPDNTVGEG